MKLKSYSILIIIIQSLISNKGIANNKNRRVEAEELLGNVIERLSSIHTINYDYHRELNYPSSKTLEDLYGRTYLNFESSHQPLEAKFQFECKQYTMIFNGSETFICNNTNKDIILNNSPTHEDFGNVSFLNHSLFSLRYFLPLLKVKNIPNFISDTLINNIRLKVLTFNLKNNAISTLGGLFPVKNNVEIYYKIIINPETNLPEELIQKNNVNTDKLVTTYKNVRVDSGVEPKETSWYYSNYLKFYKLKSNLGYDTNLIKVGQNSFNWILTEYNTSKKVSLSQLKGNIILLEFWITHCGYCIESIPKLNQLATKYESFNFKLYTINIHDSDELIQQFKSRNKMLDYGILIKGNDVASKYGVFGYPTAILLDKSGKILYAGEMDQTKLQLIIDENL